MTDRYERIRAALAMGPTPGPRRAVEQSVIGPQDLSILFAKVTFSVGISGSHSVPIEEAIANAALAAACDPDTIQALLDECDALRGGVAEWKSVAVAQSTEIERLREQLRLATVDQAIAEAEASDAHAENKRLRDAVPAAQAPRACTCHPDDRPDGHCRERYAASECQALAAQAQAANADALNAARYRWLRDREIPEWLDLWHQNPDRIDAAIDEAMEKENSND